MLNQLDILRLHCTSPANKNLMHTETDTYIICRRLNRFMNIPRVHLNQNHSTSTIRTSILFCKCNDKLHLVSQQVSMSSKHNRTSELITVPGSLFGDLFCGNLIKCICTSVWAYVYFMSVTMRYAV